MPIGEASVLRPWWHGLLRRWPRPNMSVASSSRFFLEAMPMVSNVRSDLRAGIAGRGRPLSLSRLALFAVIGPSLFGILIAFQDIVEWNWLTKVGWNPLSVAPVSDLAWSPIGG